MTRWRDDEPRVAGECAAFEAALPDYLDDALTPDAADAASTHLASCETCRALVRDLQAIRTQAAGLPVLRPSRDLWAGIEARLGSQVEAPAAAQATPARQRALHRWFGPHYATRVAALAAGLVIVTAAFTYLITREALGGAQHTQSVASGVPTSAETPARSGTPVMPVASTEARTSEFLYDSQIAQLHRILEQRRGQLDPKTVAVIERSLGVIDTAIAQSKAALSKDPANGFLADQLDRDLNTKLELLRTVALLPSHT